MIDKSTEQRIKDSASIVDVVSDFLELRPKGRNYECLCPFHNDRHLGSFVVSPARNCYKCFSCEAKGGPVDFLMEYAHMDYPDALRYLAHKYGIFVDESGKWKDVKPAKPRSIQDCIPADLPAKLWPAKWVEGYTNIDGDNLVRWMKSIPWDNCQRMRLDNVLKDYHVGQTHISWKGEHDFTLFWQLDNQGQLHNAHMMKYQPDGHRVKGKDDYGQTWLHARLRHAGRFDDMKNAPSYCLYGLHLLDTWPTATVCIVESEKTALLMATAYGNNAAHLWMACGGLQNLNEKFLRPLMEAKRKVSIFPDRDGIDAWTKKALEIDYPLTINTDVVTKYWHPEDGPKADIADVVVNSIQRTAKDKLTTQPACDVLDAMAKRNPALATLRDKLNLKPTNETNAEQ
jgi:hypothetical protein